QPLHAFDAGKLTRGPSSGAPEDGPRYHIVVRKARNGEKLVALDLKEYPLADRMLMIADGNADVPIGIAGVKGGEPAGITEKTKDIIIESANFDGTSVRKTAQALKLRTDASSRFEQGISPELTGYGMRAAADLIAEIAGGELGGFADVYPAPAPIKSVSVSVEKINQGLGTSLTGAEIADAFSRLGFSYKEENGVFQVQTPSERLDLVIPEDLAEEVARIVGYDKVPSVELSSSPRAPEVNPEFFAAEAAREELVSKGYSEVFTSVFTEKGERAVLNKVDSVRPYLRQSLLQGLTDALEKNKSSKDLLGLKEIKLFEIGTVWKDGKEVVMLGTVSEKQTAQEKPLESGSVIAKKYDISYSVPTSNIRYQPFSKYPYIVRDIAMWTPNPTAYWPEVVLETARAEAGDLLVRSDLFDSFENKEKRVSLAFRLIFQSFERTLTEAEVNPIMEKVSAALKAKGFEIR
ncbi:phenylalanine--tRNA ligase subunit beta, partial [Acetobacteraceae bacterium]|nr:phenylalanine--tRNA ligase subunit beta [Candidatus Parcubacteria bacterium]